MCVYGSWLNIVQKELETELDRLFEALPGIASKRNTICVCGAEGKGDAGLNRSSYEVSVEF